MKLFKGRVRPIAMAMAKTVKSRLCACSLNSYETSFPPLQAP
jgi:hypothetical protein